MQRVLNNVPLIPMRGIVALPGEASSFDVGRPMSVKAIEKAKAEGGHIVLLCQKDPRESVINEDNLFLMGSYCEILNVESESSDVRMKVTAGALNRVRILNFIRNEEYFSADVEIITDAELESEKEEKLKNKLVETMNRLKSLNSFDMRMNQIKSALEAAGHSVKIDDRDTLRPGFKFAEWELKGVPVRLAMGARDLASGTVEVARRDTLTKETMSIEGIAAHIDTLLEDIQQNIYNKALAFRDANVEKCDSWEEFQEKIKTGKFLLCHWDGTAETEQAIKEATKATIRCIPVDSYVCEEEGRDIYSGKPSSRRVVFAISY